MKHALRFRNHPKLNGSAQLLEKLGPSQTMYFIKLECIILVILVLPVLLRFPCYYREERFDQLAPRSLLGMHVSD